jgi:hypothetical protein
MAWCQGALFIVTSRQFLTLFFAGLVSIGAIVVPLNMYVDIYGLFRSAQGRRISIYGEERVAKYLHSFRYIPENFDGVLFGSSVSDSLHTRNFPGYRIYNASIDGGNVQDMSEVAENIFRHGQPKLTVICIHRYLTNDDGKKTDLMTPKQYWGALGSPQLITAYLSQVAIQRGLTAGEFDEYGTLNDVATHDVKTTQKTIEKTVAEIRLGTAAVGNYRIDPNALQRLEKVMALARHRSNRLLIFFPPVPAPILAVRATELAHYQDTISALLEPNDVVVDFNSPDYASFRENLENFIDGVHLSQAGANFVLGELGRVLNQLELRNERAGLR